MKFIIKYVIRACICVAVLASSPSVLAANSPADEQMPDRVATEQDSSTTMTIEIVTTPESENLVVIEPKPATVPVTVVSAELKPYRVALRTNLLLDLLGGPNIGGEVTIGQHFSVAGDFAFAHTRINNLYALQILQGTIEGRYWFKPGENILTGWNIGVYATYNSRFDIQWGRGYQGDGYWSAGLSGGYAWRLTDCLNLDVSALVGAVWLPEVRSYNRPQEGHLMWTETRYNATRVLPTMVRVNLVWLIGSKKKVSK